MGQEFFINSQDLEDKVRKLLPSQGGSGAGFDLSASTQIIPIIDLTESAEGSGLRVDLQSSLSFKSATSFNVTNANTTIINNTGYFRVFGCMSVRPRTNVSTEATFDINDGTSTKVVFGMELPITTNIGSNTINFDFIVFLSAGDSLLANFNSAEAFCIGSTRQIASIDGTLVNP